MSLLIQTCAALRVPALPRRSYRHRLRYPLRCVYSNDLYDSSSFDLEDFKEEDFVKEFDALIASSDYKFEVGQRIEGLVFDVDASGVCVDFGWKEMGVCKNNELTLQKCRQPIDLMKPDTRHIFEIRMMGVNSQRMGGEVTLLSRVDIVKEIAFKRLRQMSEYQIKLDVTVVKRNPGGYVVVNDLGLEGFLPSRQALVNASSQSMDDDELIGKTVTVKILDLFEDSYRYVVTRRGVLGGDVDEEMFTMGSVLEGVVEGVMPYGAFVTAGGMSGLLHSSQISGAPVSDVSSVFSVNDRIKVMVLGYDRSRGRLSFSTKRLEPNSGDMLKDPQKVYDKAEEMAEKFKKEVERAAARVQQSDFQPITPDIKVDASRLARKSR